MREKISISTLYHSSAFSIKEDLHHFIHSNACFFFCICNSLSLTICADYLCLCLQTFLLSYLPLSFYISSTHGFSFSIFQFFSFSAFSSLYFSLFACVFLTVLIFLSSSVFPYFFTFHATHLFIFPAHFT